MYKTLFLLVASTSAITISNPNWPICNGTNGPNCRKDDSDLSQKSLPICNGTNGPNCRKDEDLSQKSLPICNGTNGPNCRKDEDLLAQKKKMLPTCEP